ELGAFSREGLAPVVVVVNNDGYTIERMIHGKTAPYNDIVRWSWADIPTALGVTNHLTFRAQTYGELDDAFVAAAEHRDRMVLIEAGVPRLDIPDLLRDLVADLGCPHPAGVAQPRPSPFGVPSNLRSVRRQRPHSAPAPHTDAI